jgi:hypothetical protein
MSPGVIFIEGFIGVFFGMALIYLSIKITALIIDRPTQKNKGDS